MLESIAVKHLNLEINGTLLLSNISFTIKSGDVLVTYGPNGSGKSLLNKTLGFLISPQSGSIFWDGQEVFSDGQLLKAEEKLRRNIGFVWQHPVFLTGNVKKNIEMPLILQGLPKNVREKKIKELAIEYQIDDLLMSNPQKLSGGEKQRVSFLRAIVHDPDFLIFDEPTASLDPSSIVWFEEKIHELKKNGKLIVVTTHDLDQAKRVGTKLAVLISGKIMEYGKLDHVLHHPENDLVKSYLRGDLKALISQ